MDRGQISFEYVVLVGLLLVLLIPLIYYASSYTAQNVKISKAEDVVTSLAEAADEVYASSPGTKKYVWINVPNGVSSTHVNSTEITLVMNFFGKYSDITAITRSTVTGNIPSDSGTYRLRVELLSSGVVLIGEGVDDAPPVISWTSPDGSTCNPVILRITTNEAAVCRFDSSNLEYSSMANQMYGNALGHSYELGVQPSEEYSYYILCQDAFGNTMLSSTSVSYSVVC